MLLFHLIEIDVLIGEGERRFLTSEPTIMCLGVAWPVANLIGFNLVRAWINRRGGWTRKREEATNLLTGSARCTISLDSYTRQRPSRHSQVAHI